LPIEYHDRLSDPSERFKEYTKIGNEAKIEIKKEINDDIEDKIYKFNSQRKRDALKKIKMENINNNNNDFK